MNTKPSKHEIARYAREYSKEAIDRLLKIMRSNKTDLALKAAIAILDRGVGKPVAEIINVRDITDDDITQEIRRRMEERELEGDDIPSWHQ